MINLIYEGDFKMEYLVTHFMEPLFHKYGGFVFLFVWLIALTPVLLMFFSSLAEQSRDRDKARKIDRNSGPDSN